MSCAARSEWRARRRGTRYPDPARPYGTRPLSSSPATTPEEYLASLPDDRRVALTAVAEVVRRNLPAGYREGMQYGMIGWYVPLETFPDTYNGQPLGLAALASQKHYMSLYLNNVYGDPELEAWFRSRFDDAGKKLDMGKSCVRFRQLDDLALDVIGEAIARSDLDDYLARYLQVRGSSRSSRRTADR